MEKDVPSPDHGRRGLRLFHKRNPVHKVQKILSFKPKRSASALTEGGASDDVTTTSQGASSASSSQAVAVRCSVSGSPPPSSAPSELTIGRLDAHGQMEESSEQGLRVAASPSEMASGLGGGDVAQQKPRRQASTKPKSDAVIAQQVWLEKEVAHSEGVALSAASPAYES